MTGHAHTPLAASELRVRRLRLRGSAAQVAQARGALAALGPQAAWPPAGGDEVLLIRRLRLCSAAAALGEATAAATRALAARAADPFGPAAERAEALRFAHRADYAAWRLHQWLQPRPGQATAPTADAVAAPLCEAAAALPAVWQRLHRLGGTALLDRLWRALDAPAADRVLGAAAVATGWTRALAGAHRPVDAPAADDPAGPRQVRTAPAGPDAGRALPDATAMRARIGTPGAPAHDARTRLAALLAWWLHAPARLGAADAAGALVAAAQRLAGPQRWADPPRAAAAAHATPAGAPDHGASPVNPTADAGPATARPPAPPDHDQAAGRAGPPASTATVAVGGGQAPGDGPGAAAPAAGHRAAARAARSAATPAAAAADGPPAEAAAAGLVTGHGGLFWLLAVLALPACQRRLADLDEPQAGWREWLRLVQALGAEPDAAWWRFAAGRAGLADDDPAAWRALRWRPAQAEPLLAAAQARFGTAALQAALAPRRARVLADAVHVDVHFALDDAVLAVRRSGLDLDPGWTPWLGCVLRWHFGSALAPAQPAGRADPAGDRSPGPAPAPPPPAAHGAADGEAPPPRNPSG